MKSKLEQLTKICESITEEICINNFCYNCKLNEEYTDNCLLTKLIEDKNKLIEKLGGNKQ